MVNCNNWIKLALKNDYKKIVCPKCKGSKKYRKVTIFDYGSDKYHKYDPPQIIEWDGTEEELNYYKNNDNYAVKDTICKCDVCNATGGLYVPKVVNKNGYYLTLFYKYIEKGKIKYNYPIFYKIKIYLTIDEFKLLENKFIEISKDNIINEIHTFTIDALHNEFFWIKEKILTKIKSKSKYETLKLALYDPKYKVHITYVLDVDNFKQTYKSYDLNGVVVKLNKGEIND